LYVPLERWQSTSYNKTRVREENWCVGQESQLLEVVHESGSEGLSPIAPDTEIILDMEIKNVGRSRSLRWVVEHDGGSLGTGSAGGPLPEVAGRDTAANRG